MKRDNEQDIRVPINSIIENVLRIYKNRCENGIDYLSNLSETNLTVENTVLAFLPGVNVPIMVGSTRMTRIFVSMTRMILNKTSTPSIKCSTKWDKIKLSKTETRICNLNEIIDCTYAIYHNNCGCAITKYIGNPNNEKCTRFYHSEKYSLIAMIGCQVYKRLPTCS